MFWIALAFIVVGLLLEGKGKKEDNSSMKTIGKVVWILGLVIFGIAVLAILGIAISAAFD